MNPTEIFSHQIVIKNEMLFSTLNLYTIIFMIQFERNITKNIIRIRLKNTQFEGFMLFLCLFKYVCRGMHNKIGTTAQFYYSHSVL